VTSTWARLSSCVCEPERARLHGYGTTTGVCHQIHLATGVKKTLLANARSSGRARRDERRRIGLRHGAGASNAISRVALGTNVKTPVLTGLTAPFFIAWRTTAGASVYLAERDPANSSLASRPRHRGQDGDIRGLAAAAVGGLPSEVRGRGCSLPQTLRSSLAAGAQLRPDRSIPTSWAIGLISVTEDRRHRAARTRSTHYYKKPPRSEALLSYLREPSRTSRAWAPTATG